MSKVKDMYTNITVHQYESMVNDIRRDAYGEDVNIHEIYDEGFEMLKRSNDKLTFTIGEWDEHIKELIEVAEQYAQTYKEALSDDS